MADLVRVAFENPVTPDRAPTLALWRLNGQVACVRQAYADGRGTACTRSFGGPDVSPWRSHRRDRDATAQTADPDLAPGSHERFAFDAADTDGDGVVSEAEPRATPPLGPAGSTSIAAETLTP